jgi:hypothetical protein
LAILLLQALPANGQAPPAELRPLRGAISKDEEALPLWRSLGDARGEAHTLYRVSLLYDRIDQTPRARECLRDALPLFRSAGARSVAGLWNVNDSASADLMKSFFRGLRPQTDKTWKPVSSLVFLASLRLCVILFFQSIDDTRYTVLDQRRVEVDQQPKSFVGQPPIGQKLLFVKRGEYLDRLDLDDHLILDNQVSAEPDVDPKGAVDHRDWLLAHRSKSTLSRARQGKPIPVILVRGWWGSERRRPRSVGRWHSH